VGQDHPVRQKRRVKIRRLELEDAAAVRELVKAGLRERFDPYLEGYDPDLDDLWAHHLEFLVGELDGAIIATGGLKLQDARTVRVRRLSVAPAARGRGFGAVILRALLNEARARGYARAVLETGADWHSAIALYERAGFSRIHSSVEPETGFHSFELMCDLSADRR
jgi:GNAT superfamily N-acetyltransferase